jgi:hypothetical protein
MTLLQKALQTCVMWCEVGQKAHAWELAKTLAKNCAELGTLPEALTEEMKMRQKSKEPQIGSSTHEP